MAGKPIKIYGSSGLSSRVAMFQKKADDHRQSQLANPFSNWEIASKMPKITKEDPGYGHPVEGSKTEYRGKKAGELVSNEIRLLCDMIHEYGEQMDDGSSRISFGELFEIYTRISNKVVGILMRARKHGLVHFEGEMLFQRRDDHVLIHLLKPISEIHEMYGGAAFLRTDKRSENENHSDKGDNDLNVL